MSAERNAQRNKDRALELIERLLNGDALGVVDATHPLQTSGRRGQPV
jgi:hypothetical protein